MSKSIDQSTITIDLTHHPPRTPLGIMLAPAAANATTQINHHHPPSKPNPLRSHSTTNTTTTSSSYHSSTSLPPTSNTTVILAGWNRIPNNKLGPIQKLGPVRIGDRLVAINGVDIREMEFRHVMDLLNGMVRREEGCASLKSLSFAPFFLPSSSSSSSSSKTIPGSSSSSFLSKSRWSNLLMGNGRRNHGNGNGGSGNFGSSSSFLSSLIWNRSTGGERGGGITASASSGFTNGNDGEFHTDNAALGKGRRSDGTRWKITKHRQLYTFTSTIERIRMNHGKPSSSSSSSKPLSSSPLLSDNNNSNHNNQDEENNQHNQPPFEQYEIVCRLTLRNSSFLDSSANYPDGERLSSSGYNPSSSSSSSSENTQHLTWSVWKRYSEFRSLDERLRQTFGGLATDTQEGGFGMASFPSPKHLRHLWVVRSNEGRGIGWCRNTRLWQKQNDSWSRDENNSIDGGGGSDAVTSHQKFVRKRRDELKTYWNAVNNSEEMFDFDDSSLHRYSKDVAVFLDVEKHFPRDTGIGGGGGGVRRKRSVAGSGSVSVSGGGSVLSMSLERRRRRIDPGAALDADASTVLSQQSSRYGRSLGSNIPLLLPEEEEVNHDGEIILTEKNIETTKAQRLSSRGGVGGGRKMRRNGNAAKPAFQRRLLDSL